MDDRVVQFRVGVVVIATAIIAAILIVMFNDAPTPWRSHYTIQIRLERAPGVTVHTPIRKSGILIGRVEDVEIAEDGWVIITAMIHTDRTLRRNEQCRVKVSLLGDATLEFNPMKDRELASESIQPGETVEGFVPTDPLDLLSNMEDSLKKTVTSLGNAGEQVARITERVDNLLQANDEQIQRILGKSEAALDGITRTTDALDQILGDEQIQAKLRQGFTDLPDLIVDAREAIVKISGAVERVDRNLRNIEGFTGPLGENGEEIVTTVNTALDHLDLFVSQVLTFAESLNSSEGTIGQLLHNPDLYENVNRAVLNIERISTGLRPIIEDVRIFTDKIARDPGRLGVSGALRRRTGIK